MENPSWKVTLMAALVSSTVVTALGYLFVLRAGL
jgi:hypothetical protein